MKNIVWLFLGIVIGGYAQKIEVSAAVRAEQKASAEMEARRAAKYKLIAELKAQKQKEIEVAKKVGGENSTSMDFVNKYTSSKAKVACGNCSSFIQPLGAITSIDQRTMIIDTPGNYYFSEDIKWNPNHCPNPVAITILADNVVLDLRGHTLFANGADTIRQFTGINLFASKNVTIKNGTISGMTFYGIMAEASANINVENITVRNMKYYNVDKANDFVTPCGIILSGVNTFTVKNSKVHNLNTTSSSCAGIQVILSKHGTVVNDTVSELKNYDGSVQGFSYIESDSIFTESCHSTSFQSYYQGLTNTLGHTVLGFIPSYCSALNYNNCSAVGMIGCCDDCHGMSIFLDENVEINNFKAKFIVDGTPTYNTGAKATGLEVYGKNIKISNCTVDSIIAIVPQDLQSTGFSAWGKNISFYHCIAKNVQVLNAQLITDTTKGFGTGFGWAPDPRLEFDTVTADLVSYSNCIAVNCQLGFDTWYHTNSSWVNDTAQNCQLPLLFVPNSKRKLSMNKCSESKDENKIVVELTNKMNIPKPPVIKSN